MKIKQQKQIKAFLLNELGPKAGGKVFALQENQLSAITDSTKGKTENQIKTLVQTILPRIALYKALTESGFTADEVNTHMRRYMLDVVATKKHASTAKMERIPGFYAIYSRVFLKIMRTTDLQQSTQRLGENYYDITITRCLWHTACEENNCPELCPLFCDVDDVTYGGLKKLGFTRTQTLGYGGSCCDFHFYKK
jgi:hypothetical protein